MDELDQKILNKLRIDSSLKSEQLADSLNVTGRTIRRRLSVMKKKGEVKTIAVLNPVLLGFKGWSKIGIKVEPGAAASVEEHLLKLPYVYFATRCFGAFDFFIGGYFDSQEQLAYFVNMQLAMIPGIQNTETIPLIHPRIYYGFRWKAPAPYDKTSIQYQRKREQNKVFKFRNIDRKILDASEFTISSIPFLKTKLKISEGTIRKHIKNMIMHEMIKIEVTPNPLVLAYEVWSIIGIKVRLKSVHEVLDKIIEFPSVYLAATSLGRFNIVISARFLDTESFSRFANEDLSKIQGISYIESFILTKPLKYHNIRWSYSPDTPNPVSTWSAWLGQITKI